MANKIGDILLLFVCLYSLIVYNSIYFNIIFSISKDYYINMNYNDILIDHTGHVLEKFNHIDYLITDLININVCDLFNLTNLSITPFIICFFIIIASICKSAQAGFHF